MNKMLTCVFAMFIFVSGGAMLARAEQDVHGFLRIGSSEVHFKSPLGIGPEQAVLFGDPSKPGLYVNSREIPTGRPFKSAFPLKGSPCHGP